MDLYFLALIPPEIIKQEVKILKEEIRLKYAAKHALKLPAHITLIPPFKLQEKQKTSLLETLTNFTAREEPLEIFLSGFGGFPPGVLFIDVENKEPIIRFYDRLQTVLEDIPGALQKQNKPLHPHITLATRDLKEEFYDRAWNDLKARQYKISFTAAHLYLLWHNGRSWEVYVQFPLQEKKP
ncbi:2'-5' RNA ligase family protein [Antarcticibacterium flavum]|uniref:2'-5' RNA ligase family protein n=1 Tax=Antarcticibacterium flavum TaxID=2058175 RepID=A0A5B7X084_9FLAO|nr:MULTISPECIES: 2'-5' RNA ligase family protein [Antarcticibacterium]MCM4160185.1 2'-5' RNA ligase [Antarcticibacterium sp. W02-3]QCY68737.1 2'-5' RNA ligase family protein [Antarcticibacterium flavum]